MSLAIEKPHAANGKATVEFCQDSVVQVGYREQ